MFCCRVEPPVLEEAIVSAAESNVGMREEPGSWDGVVSDECSPFGDSELLNTGISSIVSTGSAGWMLADTGPFSAPLDSLLSQPSSLSPTCVVHLSYSTFLAGVPARRSGALVRIGLGEFAASSPLPDFVAFAFSAGAPKRFRLKISLTLPVPFSGLGDRVCVPTFLGDSIFRGELLLTSHVK
jgi:hypothetical protein